ncbi:MAG: hypothetical protein KGS61_19840 [Verrucomicrobia bacterium]|nr:hypothetical protein [Verrucomicrobiota bacterium]
MTEKQLVGVVILVGGVYGTIKAVMSARPGPDPWGADVAEALEGPDAVPVCHRCFEPQAHEGWFCPHCGAAVGPYNNCMPYLNVFSFGEISRAGVSEAVRPSAFQVVGMVLFSWCAFSIFAPVYWWVFFRQLRKRKSTVEDQTEDRHS